jgi:hypothetical protein
MRIRHYEPCVGGRVRAGVGEWAAFRWGVGFGGHVVQLVAHHAGSSTTTCSFIGVCRMHAFDSRARAAHLIQEQGRHI